MKYPPLPPIMELKTSADVREMLDRYNRGEEGYGLGRMLEAVRNSQLPEKVKRKYLIQHAMGMIYPEDFG